ncbi:MAG: ZIP family metal transporter [Candidatus Omnitrophica bacterium]|nr:ZIP family metal transporter [Candidatus Omnitrophota bacterium]MDD5573627.1 ZIP family metal transporter [Candidatus Omnitrophota bacterium]
MKTWIYALLSVFLVSIISLVGILALAIDERRLKRALLFLVSFAVGGLFGDVFIHILPEAFEEAVSPLRVSFGVIAGILLFFILEKFIYWRHCHAGVCDMHDKPVVWLNLIGDAFHNFIDGIIIGASYSVSFAIGITSTLAVVLHEIPQEIGDYGILVNGGLSRRKALGMNFLCALVAVLGAVTALLIGPHINDFADYALPLTAGGFIYLAGSDLIPELHREIRFSRSIFQLLSIICGVMVMALLLLLE